MYLVFSVRKRNDIIFEQELAQLQARYPNLHVTITLTNDPDAAWDGARGQIDEALLRTAVPDLTRGPVMLCGPDPMMGAMRRLLVGMGVPDAEIHQEEFSAPAPVSMAEAAAAEEVALPVDGQVPNVTFAKSERTTEAPAELTVLEVAEECGIAIPFECRSGICGQCKTKLVSGKVQMEVQDALTPVDRARGLILACQARAAKDLVIDA
jgi:ferredoxin-NADP reductase